MTKTKEPTIVQKHADNFETLREAFRNGDVCLMDCTDKETGEHVAVICTVQFDGTLYNTTPFAKFFNGNPYDTLEPPASSS